MDSSPFSQHSIHLGLSQAATDSNSLPLYLSSPLEPFSLSLGIRSANIAFPAGRPLSVSQDAPYCLLVPLICRLDTAEPTTSFPPEPDLPFSPQETSSSATYRGSQEEPVLSPSYSSQGSVDGSCTCRCLSSFCRDPCIWTERSPSSANIPIGDIERTARFSCPCNFASLFHSFCLWCVCWSISSSFNSLLSIHPFPLRYSSSLSQSKETPKPASIPFPRLRCTTFAPLSERRIGVFFRIHCP